MPKNDLIRKMIDFDNFKKCLRMWEIWANEVLPKALKTCPKFNKSPDLVTMYRLTYLPIMYKANIWLLQTFFLCFCFCYLKSSFFWAAILATFKYVWKNCKIKFLRWIALILNFLSMKVLVEEVLLHPSPKCCTKNPIISC